MWGFAPRRKPGFVRFVRPVKGFRDARHGNHCPVRAMSLYVASGLGIFTLIAIGGIGALAPGRRHDLARLGFRAMVGGLLATCLMACIAGVLI